MEGVALLLAAAAVGHAAARWLRVPAIPLLLLAGLGLSFLRPPPAGTVEDALVLGVTFLLFVVGLELDPRRTRAQWKAAVRVGSVQFLALAALGYGTSRALGFDAVESGYLALGLTASSTLVGIRILQRRRQMFEPFGRLVLGVLLLQDVLVLLSIPLVVELAVGPGRVVTELAAIVLLGVACVAARRWVGPFLLRVAGDEEELLLLGALGVLFVFLAAAEALAVPMVVGAFLAGVSLSRFPVNGTVRAELAPIGDFFAAIFFTALGILARVPTATEVWQAGVLAAVVLVVTTPLVTVIAERAGFAAKPAIEAGLLLSQTSEISLVIVLSGMLAGHVGSTVLTVVALVTMATMLLTPFLATDVVAWRLVHLHPSRRRWRRERAPPPRDHVLLLGAGSTGMPLLEMLLFAGCDLVVVDDDPAAIGRLAEAEVRALRGDASDPTVLQRAGADRARAIISTIRRTRDNAAVLERAGEVPVLVRVFDDEEARWVRVRGGIPVPYAAAAAEAFLEWFGETRGELEQGLRPGMSGRGSTSPGGRP